MTITKRDCLRLIIEWCVITLIRGFIAVLAWSSNMTLALKIPVTSLVIIASSIAAIMAMGILEPVMSKVGDEIDIKS